MESLTLTTWQRRRLEQQLRSTHDARLYPAAQWTVPLLREHLNPMDTLWGQGKDVVCADTQYATIDEQVERFIDYLESLSAWDALHTAGVYSRDFWLKTALRKYFCGFA